MTTALSKHIPELRTEEPNDQAPVSPDRRRWRWHLRVGLLFAVVLAGGVLAWDSPLLNAAPKEKSVPYAYALLYFEREKPTVLKEGQKGELGDADIGLWCKTRAALVKSRLVLNAALRLEEVSELPCIKEQADPVAWLESRLRVDFLESPQIMRIGMSGANADELRVLVKAVLCTYMREVVNRDRIIAHERLANLRDLMSKYEQTIVTKNRMIKQLVANGDELHPRVAALEQQLLPQELAECRRELRRVRLAKAAVQARLNQQSADKKALEEELAILTEQGKVLTNEEKQLLAKATELGESAMNVLQAEIAQTEQLIEQFQVQAEALKLELQAPPRATLLNDVTVGKAK